MASTSISLPDYQMEWVKRNLSSLSGFVQEKLKQEIKNRVNHNNNDQLLQRKYFTMSLMFLIIGIGFGMIGISFLSSNWLYEGIFALVLGVVICIYGLMGIHDYGEKKRNNKKIAELIAQEG